MKASSPGLKEVEVMSRKRVTDLHGDTQREGDRESQSEIEEERERDCKLNLKPTGIEWINVPIYRELV